MMISVRTMPEQECKESVVMVTSFCASGQILVISSDFPHMVLAGLLLRE
jgi:hypothetical protein